MTESSLEEKKKTVGILGAGQLGRMLVEAAHKRGLRTRVYSPHVDSPAFRVTDEKICADWADTEKLEEFCADLTACTLEFENVPVECLQFVAQKCPLHPSAKILEITQDRLKEKNFLKSHGIEVAPFSKVENVEDLVRIAEDFCYPFVIKSTRDGYDGKGQRLIRNPSDLEQAKALLQGSHEWVAEHWLDYQAELSLVAARNVAGEFSFLPVSLNKHRNHILDESWVPFSDEHQTEQIAQALARKILTQLEYVGVMGVEFFYLKNASLLVNELAPRPHNSGHFSLNACEYSQFDLHWQALLDEAFKPNKLSSPAVMKNVLGDGWERKKMALRQLKGKEKVFPYDYEKLAGREGRKMAHYNVLGDSIEELVERLEASEEILRSRK